MTTDTETPKRRGRPPKTAEAARPRRTKAFLSDDEPHRQRYPADELGASPSLHTMRFYELYHANQSMRAQIAAFWHGEQLKAVHERLRAAGEETEREIG